MSFAAEESGLGGRCDREAEAREFDKVADGAAMQGGRAIASGRGRLATGLRGSARRIARRSDGSVARRRAVAPEVIAGGPGEECDDGPEGQSLEKRSEPIVTIFGAVGSTPAGTLTPIVTASVRFEAVFDGSGDARAVGRALDGAGLGGGRQGRCSRRGGRAGLRVPAGDERCRGAVDGDFQPGPIAFQ